MILEFYFRVQCFRTIIPVGVYVHSEIAEYIISYLVMTCEPNEQLNHSVKRQAKFIQNPINYQLSIEGMTT